VPSLLIALVGDKPARGVWFQFHGCALTGAKLLAKRRNVDWSF